MLITQCCSPIFHPCSRMYTDIFSKAVQILRHDILPRHTRSFVQMSDTGLLVINENEREMVFSKSVHFVKIG